jgi:FLVCR family feline leukemia virus subgroup C receptor-related protein
MEYKLYRYRWVVLATFWFVMFTYGASWFATAPLLSHFVEDFSISNATAAWLLSIIGLLVVFLAFPAGYLVDRKGPRVCTVLGTFFAVVGFGIRPWMIHSYGTMLLSSIIAGFGLAEIMVSLAPVMLRWFPKKNASTSIGIASSGLFVGFGTGSLLSPVLVESFSIQKMYMFYSMLCVMAFIIWVVLGKDKPETPPEKIEKISKVGIVDGIKAITNTKLSYIYPLIGFMITGITITVSHFIPHFLEEFLSFSGFKLGLTTGLIFFGCAIGAFFCPVLASKNKGKNIGFVTILFATILWFVLFKTPAGLVFVVCFIFGFFLQGSWPIALSMQETEKGVNPSNEGVAAGMYMVGSNVGAALIPVAVGFASDNAGLKGGAIMTFVFFVVCCILWFVVFLKK